VELELDENYCYRPVETIQVARPDTSVSIAASGGADISAFEQSATLPTLPTFDPRGFIDATGAVTISPQGASDTHGHSLTWSAQADGTNYTVVCSFEPREAVTIPESIVSEVRSSGAQDLSVGVTRFESVRIDSSIGGAHVNGSFTSTYAFTF
jgi:hypothetical protein